MMEVFIVCEVLNDYILGIYTSELKAIKGIIMSIEDDEDESVDMEEMSTYVVGEDFRIFRVPLDFQLELTAHSKISTDFANAGEEIVTKTFGDLVARQRELSIDCIV